MQNNNRAPGSKFYLNELLMALFGRIDTASIIIHAWI